MKRINDIFTQILVLGCVGFCCLGVRAASPSISGKDAFAALKGLTGEWHGNINEKGKGPEVTVVYRVTAAGSAVLETLFPGSDHEMVTVYHLDGGKLVLTHYCAMGNQPHMALDKRSTAEDLVFDFAGGSNVNPRKDLHMHSARIHIESPDALMGEWTAFKDGKEAEVTRFFLARQK